MAFKLFVRSLNIKFESFISSLFELKVSLGNNSNRIKIIVGYEKSSCVDKNYVMEINYISGNLYTFSLKIMLGKPI